MKAARMMIVRGLLVGAAVSLLSGCPEDPPSDDAGVEMLGCGRIGFPALRWSAPSIGVAVGQSREAFVEFDRDCFAEVELTLTPDAAGIVELPSTTILATNTSRARFTVMGVAAGSVQVTATALHAASGDEVSAAAEVVVLEGAVAGCEGQTATGTIAPGESLAWPSGAAGIAIPEGAARADAYHVDAFETTVACAGDLTPSGFIALGPAVTFGPTHARFGRELVLTIPIELGRLPTGAHRGHVEVIWQGPHNEPRSVAIASPRFEGSAAGGTLVFEVPRLGTYQAVVSEDVPTRRSRRFTFRGILGFSMGGSGSGRIGVSNPELFDFVAPLGGPTDWTYMLEHVRRNHLGGFCTEAERVDDPSGCAGSASLARVPPPQHLHEHAQTFEHWWYDDGYEGQGGTFNRSDYISIFRDLGTMFGNPNYDAFDDPTAPNVLPPGVPDARRAMSPDLRCADPIVMPPFDGTAGDPASGSEGAGFFDDEYNPNGTYPVMTFCDGAETGDIGEWNFEGTNRLPVEIVLAVDIDGDGVRGPGEPVIRNGREPFDDFGLDGVPSAAEVSADGAAYDPVTNPDPAGDDFDFQYNPGGTENNWLRDSIDGDPCRAPAPGEAEDYRDFGLDEVEGTRQLSASGGLPGGGYDRGEGNGCHDITRGSQRMIETSPRWQVEHMDDATLADLDVFADGGIRDLFNWSVMGDMTMAGFANRGRPVRLFNGHAALHMNGAADFDYFDVPWEEVGRATMVRYGHPDTEERFIVAGDGGHVGTGQQLIDRLRGGLKVMDARWPDGDRTRVPEDRICVEGDREVCGYVNTSLLDFEASTGRRGPVTVLLPPGYFAEGNQDQGYPIVYFLHGYGMTPEDLLPLGFLMWEAMNTPRVGTERRMQKMILVFPDGRCRDDECLRGTFYTDAPESTPGGAQMQTFLLDLMAYMDETYRTRDAQSFEVVE